MRPNAIFSEYEEIEDDLDLKFNGVLNARYERIPKAQLAFNILGNQPYYSHEICKDGLKVHGVIQKKGVHEELESEKMKVKPRKSLKRYEVQEIRELVAFGWRRDDLAKEFGVSIATIGNVINYVGRFA